MPRDDTAAVLQPAIFVDRYLPSAGAYDEMRTPEGEVRPHWKYLLETLHALGPEGIEERWREARRLIRDNGVTYNVYGDPLGMSRPWDLDLLPLLIRSDEWADIERGLMQRAELLNLILLDLYGPRNLIRRGLLPPELIDGYPGYLLPCHGIRAAGDRLLIHYAADLTRAPDGSWRVIDDRTQSPSGAGYALENRVVLSRVLPSLFRDSHVHRLAGFYRSMRRTLTRLAPRRDEHARVAVLTPGPSNEAYFEHAYLANYLGYGLVQGADLSVRDGALWLRTLGRLERIDAVLRRVDDIWCDPLELREDSLLGVPGLVQATRAGNVTLANALGSGVLEHPGLAAFLPELCRALLGEDLQLPGIQTWWCGNPADRTFVLANLSSLIIKPADTEVSQRWLYGPELEPAELTRLTAAIEAEPTHYVAQEHIVPSTSPALIGSHIEPRPTILRSFLVSEEDGFTVMPGGLSRASLSPDAPMVSNQLGGLGKDTWVLASEPERQESLLVSADRLAPAVVQESEVSSRVADNLFWIGRYAERAEGLVRLLRIIIFKLFERASFSQASDASCCMRTLLEALTLQTLTYPGFVGKRAAERLADPVPEMLSLISDANRLGGLPQTLQALGQAAWSVRDRLSTDTWRVVNDIEVHLRSLTKQPPAELAGALDELDPLITSLVAFSALTQENMTHNEGWHFLEAGRRVERGANLSTLLGATLVPVSAEVEETLVVESVLGVTDSLITYRRRYQAGTRVGALLDLVFQDESNPRALAYQLVKLECLVAEMPRANFITSRTPAQRLMLKLVTEVRLAEIDELVQAEARGRRREALDEALGTISSGIAALSDALTAQYFRHEERPHSLLHRGDRGIQ
ncbi:MAG: circularly permuted type 2 ATP-grasp protein [Chromatiaceae bacterium]